MHESMIVKDKLASETLRIYVQLGTVCSRHLHLGTSLIINRLLLGPCSRHMRRALWRS